MVSFPGLTTDILQKKPECSKFMQFKMLKTASLNLGDRGEAVGRDGGSGVGDGESGLPSSGPGTQLPQEGRVTVRGGQ